MKGFGIKQEIATGGRKCGKYFGGIGYAVGGICSQNIESNRGIAFWRLGESMQRRLDEIVKGEANLHKLP